MWLRLSLIVPAIGDIGVKTVMPHQAGAGHPQPVEVSLSQIADIEAQPLRFTAVLDDELQQDEALTRIAEARAGLEMDVQLTGRVR
jgi:hypothetical protein